MSTPGRLSRLLAPLALLACIAAVAVVATSTMGTEESARVTSTSTAKSGTSTSKATSSAKKRKTYTVKSGDVLSVIAESNGITVEELIRLNPGVDPQSLRTGQRLKLVKSS